MKKVVYEGGASYYKIWCVRHSLGSHVCGNAGRNTPQKISSITGELAASISSKCCFVLNAVSFYFLILDKENINKHMLSESFKECPISIG